MAPTQTSAKCLAPSLGPALTWLGTRETEQTYWAWLTPLVWWLSWAQHSVSGCSVGLSESWRRSGLGAVHARIWGAGRAFTAKAGPSLLPPQSQSDIGSSHWNINQNSGNYQHFIRANIYCVPWWIRFFSVSLWTLPKPCIPRSPSWKYFAKHSNWIDCAFFLEQLTARVKRACKQEQQIFATVDIENVSLGSRCYNVTLCGQARVWSEHYITRRGAEDNKHWEPWLVRSEPPDIEQALDMSGAGDNIGGGQQVVMLHSSAAYSWYKGHRESEVWGCLEMSLSVFGM